MAHPFSTQTLGKIDLSAYVNANSHQSFENLSHVAATLPHEWMMNGKYGDNIDYLGRSFGRDGLGHGVGEVEFREVVWNGGLKNRDWDGGNSHGIFLEHCLSKDCFFGCRWNHSHNCYGGGYEVSGNTDLRYGFE